MALMKMPTYAGGGSIDYSTFFNNLTTANQATASGTIDYTFTVGKTYFIKYNRGGTQTELGVQSGATVISEGTAISKIGSNVNEYFGIIKATSSTIILYGNNNTVVISQLD